jgi:signal transduction histidine kinase
VPSHIKITSSIVKGADLNNEKLSPGKNYSYITVIDNGIGFEPQFSERIFGVFQKLHGKEVYAGTGIGLAIVKKIVENHNGIISATSELNKGAQFDIYIPAS